MIGIRAARRYAKAVLLQASETNTAHVAFEDMQSISKTISDNSDLSEMLLIRFITMKIKKKRCIKYLENKQILPNH